MDHTSEGSVLITGVAGYVGSHVCVELLAAGHRVVGVDNFDNSHPDAVSGIKELGGHFDFVELDLNDRRALESLFAEHDIKAVVHMVGLKSVGESTAVPLSYYDVNVGLTVGLLRTMDRHGVTSVVFSSSCTVYGNPGPESMPLTEGNPLAPVSPYGHSKAMVERILQSQVEADPRWQAVSLRYFNPIGAHPSGLIGEDAVRPIGNLMPQVMRVALKLVGDDVDGDPNPGRSSPGTVDPAAVDVPAVDPVIIHGADYETVDGTCVRDYIHVVDVARAHVAAVDHLSEHNQRADPESDRFLTLNLGTGAGYSVHQLLDAVEDVIGRNIPRQVGPRRPGDAVAVYADPTRAGNLLAWRADYDLSAMCRHHWQWARIRAGRVRPAPVELA